MDLRQRMALPLSLWHQINRRRLLKLGAYLASFGIGASLGWRNGWHSFTYRGHSRAVTGIAWSPNGRRIASTSEDGSTQVWDARTGDNAWSNYILTTKWTMQDIPVTAVVWSPDSTRIVITSAAGDVVMLRDTPVSAYVWTIVEATPHTPAIHAVAWSPDGTRIAAGCRDGTIPIWRGVCSGQSADLTLRSDTGAITALAWSPDSTHLASGDEMGWVYIWDVSTGACVADVEVDGTTTSATGELVLTHTAITALSWQPGGENVLFTSADGWFNLWNARAAMRDGMPQSATWEQGRINAVAWFPDKQHFVLGLQNGTIEIWDTATAFASVSYGPLAALSTHRKAVNAVACSPNGRAIASASSDATVRIEYGHWWSTALAPF